MKTFPVHIVDPTEEGEPFAIGDEVFHLRTALPASLYIDLDMESISYAFLLDFISSILVEGEQERFEAVWRDTKSVPDMHTLRAIFDWALTPGGAGLFPFVRERPTPSDDGDEPTSPSSSGGSRKRAGASRTSAPTST